MNAGAGRLVILAKAPRAGRVKTRLAAGIGAARAAGFYRASTDILVRRLAGDPRWRTLLAADPPAAERGGWSHLWPPGVMRIGQVRIGQRHADLGARLIHVLFQMQSCPGPVVIIGTDAPQITARDIAAAFAALSSHDAVIGPAPDGGYWLIGLKRPRVVSGLFGDVRWSGPQALADTLASMPDGWRVARLAQKRDIDAAADLAAAPFILLRSVNHRAPASAAARRG